MSVDTTSANPHTLPESPMELLRTHLRLRMMATNSSNETNGGIIIIITVRIKNRMQSLVAVWAGCSEVSTGACRTKAREPRLRQTCSEPQAENQRGGQGFGLNDEASS